MSDVFETKKITELSEATSAADSDLMMVGDPSTGELSKITKDNYLSEIKNDLSELENDSIINAGTKLDNGTDLNDVTTYGKYYTTSSTSSSGVVNSPTTARFSLYVFCQSNNCLLQVLTANTDKAAILYAREQASGTFSSWYRFATYSELSELNNTLTSLDERVTALEKAAGISANESPSSVEPGPEESGDDDGTAKEDPGIVIPDDGGNDDGNTAVPDPEDTSDDE